MPCSKYEAPIYNVYTLFILMQFLIRNKNIRFIYVI